MQQQPIPAFHCSLNPNGILLLGNSKTIGSYTNLFTSLNNKARVYQRLDAGNFAPIVPSPLSSNTTQALENTHRREATSASLEDLANHLALKQCAPAAALVNQQGDILYLCGHTGKYLEPAAGKEDWIFAMARAGLGDELAAALHKAIRQKDSVTLKKL